MRVYWHSRMTCHGGAEKINGVTRVALFMESNSIC